MNCMDILLTYNKDSLPRFNVDCPGNFIFPGGEI